MRNLVRGKEVIMKTLLKVAFVLAIGFALTLSAGCATKKATYSGFLKDYSGF
jgi:hypothetical protein